MMPEKVFSFPGKRGLLSLSSYPLLPPPPPMGRRERGGASQPSQKEEAAEEEEEEGGFRNLGKKGRLSGFAYFTQIFPLPIPISIFPKKIWAKLNSIKPRAFSSIDLFFSIEGDWGQEKELASSSSVSNFSSSSIE